MTKLKKLIKNNWIITLYYLIGFAGAVIIGWLLGRPNMLHATAFSGSSITYNEGQILYSSTDQCYMFINQGTTYYYIQKTCLNPNNINYGSNVYTGGSISGNTITGLYSHMINGNTGNISQQYGTYTLTINSNTVNLAGGLGTPINENYSILATGYTEEQYLAYGTQQYNAGYSAGVAYVQAHPAEYNLYTAAQYSANYTAGQNAVINSPNTYNLYTQAQYNANYTSGYNAGVAYVQNHPSEYGLYTTAQYTAYGTAQYTAGQNAVLNNPNSYNLYTTAQYNSYGSSQYTAGETAVQNDPNSYGLYTQAQMNSNYQAGIDYVVAHPDEYNLYTTAQYNANAQAQYNAGYAAGLIDNSAAYNAGIQYVLDNPNDYNLYTTTQYTNYGTQQYNAGITYVVANPNEYGLYSTNQYNDKYQEGYQAGITQGENNVTSSPNDYGLYTEQQYINNSEFSDFILQNIDTVWINQPVYNSQSGYWESNWTKISNNNLTIQDGTIRLDNIYSNYNNIAEIQIFLKSYFTNDIPLTFKNILDPNIYNQTAVDLYCYNQLPTDTWLSGLGVMCQVIPGLTSNVNGTEIEYSALVNNTNYFNAMYGSTEEMAYMTNIKYNSIGIRRWSVVGSPMLYLNSEINEINFDISGINFTSYNLGYNKGYKTGQQANQQSLYNSGYNDGYEAATAIYDDTGAAGNTLVGLAGTILFSPVKMMKDIFNFEILGVNLAGFILSIITLFVVIWLIKRLM